nr:hypothetical protein [uncultured Oscillibacter sp.]
MSLPGCFGYELDLDKLSPEDQDLIPQQLEEYLGGVHPYHTVQCQPL